MARVPSNLYKIRSPKTGLYSKGGQGVVSWGKVGKTWVGITALKLHLAQHPPEKTEDWIVEEYYVTPGPVFTVGTIRAEDGTWRTKQS